MKQPKNGKTIKVNKTNKILNGEKLKTKKRKPKMTNQKSKNAMN